MKRFLVDSLEGDEAIVTGERLHHLARVLRLGPGAEVEVFDGRGGCRLGRILEVDESRARIALGARREAPPAVAVTLGQALVKADKLEWVIQKATEVGAARIAPLELARSVVRLESAKVPDRLRRWRRIAEEAARQSGRADVPEVEAPTGLEAFLDAASGRGEAVALLWEGKREGQRLGDWVDRNLDRPLSILVGPEGGLSEAEVALARERGAAIVGLGPRILRSETAGIVGLALVLHHLGELG